MRQLKWAALAAYLAVCVLVFPVLPERIPIHFRGTGTADRWADKKLLVWLALPLLLAVLFLVMERIADFTTRHPELWNVPQKDRFLSLDEEQRAPIYALLNRFLDVTAIFMMVLFAAIQFMMYVTAVEHAPWPGYFPTITIVFAGAMVAYAVIFTIRLNRLISSADDQSALGRMR